MINKIQENTNDIKNQEKYENRVRAIICEKSQRLGRPLYVFVQTFGCQQNEADSERILGSAENLGYLKTDSLEDADLIIFNTCAVREHAELKALSKTGQLKHLKEKNKELLIGLWGCMVTQDHRKNDIKMKYPYVDFVAGTNMLHRLPEILCDVLVNDRRRYYVEDVSDSQIVEGVPAARNSDIKAWLSIMYGCDNFCTYCVVPYVRGRERSRTPDVILDEANDLVKSGFKDITLLGQNVNSYGKKLPLSESKSFSELLRDIAGIDGDFWIRFMTSHPKDASDELIDAISENEKIARHFHLPVQSGSNEILRRMNRIYTREHFIELAEKIKKKVPGITLTTDIIVGFPGETEKDFLDTLDIVKKIEFDSVYSFIYSPRAGTPAAKMEDPVSYEEKSERFSRLVDTQTKITSKLNAGYLGKTIKVLCESHLQDANGFLKSRSSGNKIVSFSKDIPDDLYGKFCDVEITKVSSAQIFGKLKKVY